MNQKPHPLVFGSFRAAGREQQVERRGPSAFSSHPASATREKPRFGARPPAAASPRLLLLILPDWKVLEMLYRSLKLHPLMFRPFEY